MGIIGGMLAAALGFLVRTPVQALAESSPSQIEEEVAPCPGALTDDDRRRLQSTTIIEWDYASEYGTRTVDVSGSARRIYAPTIPLNRVRITVGRLTESLDLIARARLYSTLQLRTSLTYTASFAADFDLLYLDYLSPGNWRIRFGRDYWSLGDENLLLNFSASRYGVCMIGLSHGFTWTGLSILGTPSSPGTIYAARLQRAGKGWTVGANYFSFNAGPSLAAGASGWSFDWSSPEGEQTPVTFKGEYASLAPAAGCPRARLSQGVMYGCTALLAKVVVNLKALGVLPQYKPSLEVWYKDYRAGFVTTWGSTADLSGVVFGGFQPLVTAWGLKTDLRLLDTEINKVRASLGYESGRSNASTVGYAAAGEEYRAFLARISYTHNNASGEVTVGLEHYSFQNVTRRRVPQRAYALYVSYTW